MSLPKHFVGRYSVGLLSAYATFQPYTKLGKLVSYITVALICAGICLAAIYRADLDLNNLLFMDFGDLKSINHGEIGILLSASTFVAYVFIAPFFTLWIRIDPEEKEKTEPPFYKESHQRFIRPVNFAGLIVYFFVIHLGIMGSILLVFTIMEKDLIDFVGSLFLLALSFSIYIFSLKKLTRHRPNDPDTFN